MTELRGSNFHCEGQGKGRGKCTIIVDSQASMAAPYAPAASAQHTCRGVGAASSGHTPRRFSTAGRSRGRSSRPLCVPAFAWCDYLLFPHRPEKLVHFGSTPRPTGTLAHTALPNGREACVCSTNVKRCFSSLRCNRNVKLLHPLAYAVARGAELQAPCGRNAGRRTKATEVVQCSAGCGIRPSSYGGRCASTNGRTRELRQ